MEASVIRAYEMMNYGMKDSFNYALRGLPELKGMILNHRHLNLLKEIS